MSAISSPRIARVVGRCSLEASVLSNGTVVVAVPRAGLAARLLTAVLLAQSFVWVLEAGVGPTFDELRAGLEALLLDDREQGYSRVLARRYWQATDGRWHRSSEPEAGTTVLVRAWTKLDVAAASPCRYPAGLVPHADLDAFPDQWSGELQPSPVLAVQHTSLPSAHGSDPARPACALTLSLHHVVADGGALFQLARDLMSACRGELSQGPGILLQEGGLFDCGGEDSRANQPATRSPGSAYEYQPSLVPGFLRRAVARFVPRPGGLLMLEARKMMPPTVRDSVSMPAPQ